MVFSSEGFSLLGVTSSSVWPPVDPASAKQQRKQNKPWPSIFSAAEPRLKPDTLQLSHPACGMTTAPVLAAKGSGADLCAATNLRCSWDWCNKCPLSSPAVPYVKDKGRQLSPKPCAYIDQAQSSALCLLRGLTSSIPPALLREAQLRKA